MNTVTGAALSSARRARPERAIATRRTVAAAKVITVERTVKALGRTGVPITRAAVALLAGVSRSFTYQNNEANAFIVAAQTRTQVRLGDRVQALNAQQQASWQERALNAEDQLRAVRRELAEQRQLVGNLIGQLREPDGTWIEDDRNQLRQENEQLRSQRDTQLRERNTLHRPLDGARANVSRLNQQRVSELFPDGPGRHHD